MRDENGFRVLSEHFDREKFTTEAREVLGKRWAEIVANRVGVAARTIQHWVATETCPQEVVDIVIEAGRLPKALNELREEAHRQGAPLVISCREARVATMAHRVLAGMGLKVSIREVSAILPTRRGKGDDM